MGWVAPHKTQMRVQTPSQLANLPMLKIKLVKQSHYLGQLDLARHSVHLHSGRTIAELLVLAVVSVQVHSDKLLVSEPHRRSAPRTLQEVGLALTNRNRAALVHSATLQAIQVVLVERLLSVQVRLLAVASVRNRCSAVRLPLVVRRRRLARPPVLVVGLRSEQLLPQLNLTKFSVVDSDPQLLAPAPEEGLPVSVTSPPTHRNHREVSDRPLLSVVVSVPATQECLVVSEVSEEVASSNSRIKRRKRLLSAGGDEAMMD